MLFNPQSNETKKVQLVIELHRYMLN